MFKNCNNKDDAKFIIQNAVQEPYKSVFEWLLDLAYLVVKDVKSNRMDAKNMAVVFCPNLYESPDINSPDALALSQNLLKFTEFAIRYRIDFRDNNPIGDPEERPYKNLVNFDDNDDLKNNDEPIEVIIPESEELVNQKNNDNMDDNKANNDSNNNDNDNDADGDDDDDAGGIDIPILPKDDEMDSNNNNNNNNNNDNSGDMNAFKAMIQEQKANEDAKINDIDKANDDEQDKDNGGFNSYQYGGGSHRGRQASISVKLFMNEYDIPEANSYEESPLNKTPIGHQGGLLSVVKLKQDIPNINDDNNNNVSVPSVPSMNDDDNDNDGNADAPIINDDNIEGTDEVAPPAAFDIPQSVNPYYTAAPAAPNDDDDDGNDNNDDNNNNVPKSLSEFGMNIYVFI